MSEIIGNLSLRLANSAAAGAEANWREHRRECARCAIAQRTRNPAGMCGSGARLYADRNATAAELARERYLSKMPDPSQDPLWSYDSLAVPVVAAAGGGTEGGDQ